MRLVSPPGDAGVTVAALAACPDCAAGQRARALVFADRSGTTPSRSSPHWRWSRSSSSDLFATSSEEK